MDTINVLVTGAGAPGGPGIIKALLTESWIKVIAADADEKATGRFLAKHFVQLPKADDPSFIESLLNIAKQYAIDVIFPLVTKELFLFSKHKQLFDQVKVKVIVSDYKGLLVANNKSELCKFLQRHQITTPDFFVVENIDEFHNAVFRLGYPHKPVCFKPSISNGSRGFRILDHSVDPYRLLFNEKPNNTYASLESIVSTLHGKPFVELLVSEYLPGDEYTIDCIAQNGECFVIIPRKRIKMIEGISVKGQFVNHEEIIAYCKSVVALLKLDGPIGLQVKQAANGPFKILEINPRIQGTSTSAIALGVNLPVLAVMQAVAKPFVVDHNSLKWGTHFARYWEEIFYA